MAGYSEQIEVCYHFPVNPELKPDEYLNCDLKGGVHSGNPVRTNKQLTSGEITKSHMRILQSKPKRVDSYFKHENIRYAAWQLLLIAGLLVSPEDQSDLTATLDKVMSNYSLKR